MPSVTFWLQVGLAIVASISGFCLLSGFEFLIYPVKPIWNIPVGNLVTLVLMLSLSVLSRLLAANSLALQSISFVSLAISLTWLPLSIVFSGNVRHIFSSASLVPYHYWMAFSIAPIVLALIVIIWRGILKLINAPATN